MTESSGAASRATRTTHAHPGLLKNSGRRAQLRPCNARPLASGGHSERGPEAPGSRGGGDTADALGAVSHRLGRWPRLLPPHQRPPTVVFAVHVALGAST